MRAKTAVVLGAQWGDEGKGKIVDVLSERFAVVARYAGGHNAGHTVIIRGQKFILQLVPCGVLRPDCQAVIGNGVVLDPMAFLKEVEKLGELGVDVRSQLFVSNRAQVILPYHRMIELASENAPGRTRIGTTSRGIGPAYEDKMHRSGLRVVDLLNRKLLKTHIENACREKNDIAHALFGTDPLDPEQMYEEYAEAAERIRPYVTDTALLLNTAIKAGKSVMFEGAQGTMLDIDHGTYPFVTSSSATAGGAVTGTGVGPTRIGTVIGVTKAYVTRVGEGPFPTEIHDAPGELLRTRGQEFGAVTGRPRRCGWLDLPLLRYSNQVNGTEWLVVTKMDVLDAFQEIPVCTGYRIDGKETDIIPADVSGLESIEPIYTKLKGWHSSTEGIRSFDELPPLAQNYLRFLERESGAKIGMVSTGPDREQTIQLPAFRDALDAMSTISTSMPSTPAISHSQPETPSPGGTMVSFTVRMRFASEDRQQVSELLRDLAGASRQEPGCVTYVPHFIEGEPDTVLIYEQYVDQAALEAHRGSEHFRKYAIGGLSQLMRERSSENLTAIV